MITIILTILLLLFIIVVIIIIIIIINTMILILKIANKLHCKSSAIIITTFKKICQLAVQKCKYSDLQTTLRAQKRPHSPEI